MSSSRRGAVAPHGKAVVWHLAFLMLALACAAAIWICTPCNVAWADDGSALSSSESSESGESTADGTDGETSDDSDKVTTPTVEKQVAETAVDGTISWQDVADVQVDVWTAFKLTGTLPSNWSDFTFYYYEFHDALPDALELDLDSVAIVLCDADGEEIADITDAFEVALEDQVLTAVCDDLLEVEAVAAYADASCTIVLTYDARLLAEEAVAGTEGLTTNYVYIEYTSKYWTTAHGRSVEDDASVLTWALVLTKISSSDAAALAGASFTVQNASGLYVTADGTLSETVYEFVTGSDGTIAVSGLDSGTYTVTETVAPSGYELADPFELTISTDLTGDEAMLSATSTGSHVTLVEADAESGTVTATVEDDETTEEGTGSDDGESSGTSGLAKTSDSTPLGLLIAIVGVLVAAAAVFFVLAARRRNDDDGEET